MNPRNLFFVVAAAIVMGASFTLMGQGLTDGIKVTLPYPVTVGDVVLDPGEYEIRRPSTTNDQILRFFSNDKFRYQTVAQTIPAEGEKTPEETKVILHHIGDKYYFDKIWMQDRTYGFEFPLPDKVRELQRELAITVPAKYENIQEERNAASNAPSPSANAQSVPVNETNNGAEAVTAPERQAEPERQDVAALQREQSENPIPPAVESRQDNVQSNPASQNNQTSTNQRANDQLPATASDWLAYVLGGFVLLVMAGLNLKTRTQE